MGQLLPNTATRIGLHTSRLIDLIDSISTASSRGCAGFFTAEYDTHTTRNFKKAKASPTRSTKHDNPIRTLGAGTVLEVANRGDVSGVPTNSLVLYIVAVATSPLPQFVVQRCVTPLLSRACTLPNCSSLRLNCSSWQVSIITHQMSIHYASDNWSRSSAPAIGSECTSCVDNPVRARLQDSSPQDSSPHVADATATFASQPASLTQFFTYSPSPASFPTSKCDAAAVSPLRSASTRPTRPRSGPTSTPTKAARWVSAPQMPPTAGTVCRRRWPVPVVQQGLEAVQRLCRLLCRPDAAQAVHGCPVWGGGRAVGSQLRADGAGGQVRAQPSALRTAIASTAASAPQMARRAWPASHRHGSAPASTARAASARAQSPSTVTRPASAPAAPRRAHDVV